MEVLRETITERSCGEGTVAVVLTETAGTVATDGEACEQEVVPVVVKFAEEGNEGVAGLATIEFLSACCSGRPHVEGVFNCELLSVTADVDNLLLVEFHTTEYGEGMILWERYEIVGGG